MRGNEITFLEHENGEPVRLPFTPPFGLSADTFFWVQIAAIAALFVLWYGLYRVVLWSTSPTPLDPAPPTQELPGEEPPAVVSLLVNRWRLTEDGVEATVLDLAARRWIELRQPGADPRATTVHLLKAPAQELKPYEERVLSRIRAEARGGVVPLTALTFRDHGQAAQWQRAFDSEVIEDARERGLSRPRFSKRLVTLLSTAAAVPSAAVGLLIAEVAGDLFHLFWGLFTFAGLSALAGRPLGERDTKAGHDVGNAWAGVRAFLRNDEAFAELPPSAVTVWDRYLSYGTALGTARVCSMVLDLGMGDRTRVWSSYTGPWRQVRVRYPRFWGRYGKTAQRLLLVAIPQLVVGGWILRNFADGAKRELDSMDALVDLVWLTPILIGAFLFVRGAYRIVRTLIDLATPRTIEGEVLWVSQFQSETQNDTAVVVTHHLALDDGTADRTLAWVAPSDQAIKVRDGDEARIVVRPWSRRVLEVTQLKARHNRLGTS